MKVKQAAVCPNCGRGMLNSIGKCNNCICGTGMYIVGHTEKPDFKETYHNTLEEAEQRIEAIAQTDPVGVDKGHYYIDGPCLICEKCHEPLDYVFIPFIVGYESELVEWREVTFCSICDKDNPVFAERSYYDKGIYGLTEHGRIP